MHTVLNLDERTVDEFCESYPTCKHALFGPQAKDTAGGDRRADGEENRQHRRLKTVFLPLLAILVGLLLSTPRASAQTDSWPSVETVLADTHGTDPLDTAARQRAALMALSDMVRDSASPKQTFNLPEPLRRQVQTYSAAAQVIFNKTVAELDPPGAPKAKTLPERSGMTSPRVTAVTRHSGKP